MFLQGLNHWKTQLNILWLGQAILMAVMASSLPYWPLYVAELGDYTPTQIRYYSAAIYLAPFVSSIFSSPWWGRLGDKYGYKPMVVRATFGLFITQTLILIFPNVYFIFLIRLLQGVLAGFIVAAQAWAIAISPHLERGATIGKLQSATAVGNLLGPLLGGVIATFAGYHSIFSLSSVICISIALIFIFLLQDIKGNSTEKTDDFKLNIKTFINFQSLILSLLFVILMMQLARSIVTPFFSLFVTEKLGGNNITVGVLYAATGFMVFISAPLWGKYFDKKVKEGESVYPIIAFILFLTAAIQILHVGFDTPIPILILRLLWGVCLGALLPVLLRLLVDQANSQTQGTFLGLGNSATKLGNLLGIILGALLETNLGYANSFLMIAMLYVVCGIIVLFTFKPIPLALKEERT